MCKEQKKGMKELLEQDLCRYADRKGMPEFQKYFRLPQTTPQGIRKNGMSISIVRSQ